MKKLMFFVAAVVVASFASSCSSGDCVTCTGGGSTGTICESDYNDGGTGVTWAEYRDALIASGNCE
jgi:hypothetical protein